jgi:DNA-binding transcriptional ArsR family regulator
MELLATDQKARRISAALSNKMRQRILEILGSKEMTVKEVYKVLQDVKYKDTIFRHLEVLKGAGIVSKRYDDNTKQLKYRIAVDEIVFRLLKN